MTPKIDSSYSPSTHDRYDSAIDSVGRKIQPAPYRNGAGPDVLGPRNHARERQQPDVISPPSTDDGTLPNTE